MIWSGSFIFSTGAAAQEPSVARLWNEVQLDAIRIDTPRPTVHARNLFHAAAVMYDAWAAYDAIATPYVLGHTFGTYTCRYNGIPAPDDVQAARREAISYAAYGLLSHRFQRSPNAPTSQQALDSLMAALGYDPAETSTDYASGHPAALGNYIARCMIEAGLQDGSNEANNYVSRYYEPVNEPLIPAFPGNPTLTDPNRWQPLVLDYTVDDEGNVVPGTTPAFLSPEWGQVVPFALSLLDLAIYDRGGNDYWVYHDPGPPPHIELGTGYGFSADYIWNFTLVAVWSGHLDPADGVTWDISPATRGNTDVDSLPATLADYRDFYDLIDGGITANRGHDVNPHTGVPYEPQIVPRGDYTRVLAEFWADGPGSETPPGHWFTILNKVNDHPALVKAFAGEGPVLDDLEWDVKGYFLLGAAMHDVAVTVWGIKGWHDYVRPISAIRALADRGQSSDPNLPGYSPDGLPLIEGVIELVTEGDSLAGADNEHVGKLKLRAWRGPETVEDPETTHAGAGWILAETWWPYQRPSFITPPFGGYISGHSTFSRAAAEILTKFTGDAFFPGGLGEYVAPAGEFLVYEDGPSVDVTLQWATYRDAADETSLSRIWGGIHPPIDDIPGRKIGIEVAGDVFDKALNYFSGVTTGREEAPPARPALSVDLYPNPVGSSGTVFVTVHRAPAETDLQVYNLLGQEVLTARIPAHQASIRLDTGSLAAGVYLVRVTGETGTISRPLVVR